LLKPAIEAREGDAAGGAGKMERVGEVHALFGPVERRPRRFGILSENPRQVEKRANRVDELLAA
jgi:hypothetical protein